jgi:hypothetical protein
VCDLENLKNEEAMTRVVVTAPQKKEKVMSRANDLWSWLRRLHALHVSKPVDAAESIHFY